MKITLMPFVFIISVIVFVCYSNFSWHRLTENLQLSHYIANSECLLVNSSSCLFLPLCALPEYSDKLSAACRPHLTILGRLACRWARSPLLHTSSLYAVYVIDRFYKISSQHIKGVDAVMEVGALLQNRLSQNYYIHNNSNNKDDKYTAPLILHFAGDNGVGKTRLAEIISLSMAQRCGDALCRIGESTLELSGGSYDGLHINEFRRLVIHRIVEHARIYPHNGVIIWNELSLLPEEFVHSLNPLLGHRASFPNYPEVDLRGQIVVITTDFGREGRTRGKSVEEMRNFIHTEFRQLYGQVSSSHLHTFPFLPISLDTAAAIVEVSVNEMACQSRLTNLQITNYAVMWLLEHAKLYLASENGRAIVQVVEMFVSPLIMDEVMNTNETTSTDQVTAINTCQANKDDRNMSLAFNKEYYVIDLNNYNNALVLHKILE